MLRITEKLENKTLRLRLDGTISETSFEALQDACARHQKESDGEVILLDMGGVVFMNSDTASKLVRLCNQRLRIINCSPFIETLLNTVAWK